MRRPIVVLAASAPLFGRFEKGKAPTPVTFTAGGTPEEGATLGGTRTITA
jgi:hypothetical protein